MSISIDLSNKTALITGATRGIGKAISESFIEAGAKVLLTGTKRSEIDKLNLENENNALKWIEADFSSQRGIATFIENLQITESIDICVNNAGINIIKPFTEYSTDEYQRLLSINLTAPFSIVQHIIPIMKEQRFGRIVNIASIWSQISKVKRSLYSTSKTGLIGFTRALAVEYASSNILINSVSPGFTMTELTEKSLSSDDITNLSKQIPVGRFAEPNEIAKVVLFLCSDMNTYITGQNILIDGGFTIV